MISDEIAAWLADVAQQRKRTTADFYRNRSKWILAAFAGDDWPQLTAQRVLAALNAANRWPDGRQKAPDTQRANIIAWDQFQKWAIDTGRLADPITSKKIKKPGGRLREILPTADDLRRILAAASPAWARLYQVLLFTGARPGELCRATIADLDRKRRVISLKDHKTAGKTRRPRIIPLSQPALALVLEAIGTRVTGPIFLSTAGQAWTVNRVSQIFRRLRKRCLVDRRIVLYSTRHKLATELCKAKGIAAAAGVLGHAGLQTIKRYVHHDAQELVGYVDEVDVARIVDPPPDATPAAPESPSSPPKKRRPKAA